MLSVGGRNFRTQEEYEAALKDQEIIDRLNSEFDLNNPSDVKKLYTALQSIRFVSMVGKDFDDKVYDLYTELKETKNSYINKKADYKAKKERKRETSIKKKKSLEKDIKTENKKAKSVISDPKIKKEVIKELKKRYRNRNILIATLILISFFCIGYFVKYYYETAADEAEYRNWAELKNTETPISIDVKPIIKKEYDEEVIIPEILDEYKLLYNKNKSLIGWIKIDDTKIDYPVMQTVNNEYYLKHNFEQKEDSNGCIFMDKDCDVILGNTNYILYGHHMKSGKMFGSLVNYGNEEFYEKHKIIHFDTIYQKGDYEIMYVFRSRIYNADEITFKYYQFIDANSEAEFESYMEEMSNLSLYDTGVTASFGDHLLTLSTCDYQEQNGRFVVVAKRIDE